VEGVIDADVKGSFQGKMQVSVDTILPGRQGQITYTPTEQEKQIAMKEDDAIEEEFVKEPEEKTDDSVKEPEEITDDSGPEEGKKKHKKKGKGGKQHE
jgi:hypothetical protein